MENAPEVVDLGRSDYAVARAAMLRLADRVRKHEVAGCVLLVEHEPVYTAGRATPGAELADASVPIVEIERGGKLTYHGPGQLVVYPVLRVPGRDVRGWLRRLEALGVAVCRAFGLQGVAAVDGTGVFVDGRKVASIGVAIRQWVSIHGMAINADMDLSPFHRIMPCGLAPEKMSDLTREAGRRIGVDAVKDAVRRCCGLLTAPAAAKVEAKR